MAPKGMCFQDDLSLLMLTLIPSLSSVFQISPHPATLFSTFHTDLFEGSHYMKPTVTEWGLRLFLLEKEYLPKLFGILLPGRLVSFHLFNYLLISVWIGGYFSL